MKKIAGLIGILGMTFFMLAGCGQDKTAEKDASLSAGNETPIENGVGLASVVSIKDAYYNDLLTTDAGELYALTDGYTEDGTDPVLVWKSSDRGENWEEVIKLPDTLSAESYISAGVLQEGTDGLNAFVAVSDPEDSASDSGGSRLLRITENGSEELDTADVFEKLGGSAWKISIVNDHVLSIAGIDKCILYDMTQQKALKTLTYDYGSAGFLSMKDQFIVYCDEIKYCLNAETLEEQEPEDGLEQFVEAMWEANDREVFAPMKAWNDTVVCVTSKAIYEYRDGRTVNALSVPNTVRGGTSFNGMAPICKGSQNTYYLSTLSAGETTLWRIEPDPEKETAAFTIYSLTKSPAVTQTAMLYQQEHPELKVELRVGMEDEAALTRTDAIKQLNTELMSGSGPDLIVMDGLSVEKYTDMGLLLPLDVNVSDDRYFENIAETYQKDGSLYAIPTEFLLYAVQGPTDPASEIGSPSEVGQWILKNADQAGLAGYEYTGNYKAFSQYAQFLYDVYAENMIQDHMVDKNTLTEYLGVCGTLAESASDKTLEEDAVTRSIQAGQVEIHYNDSVHISAGLVAGVTDIGALTTQKHNGEAEYALYPMYQPCNILAVNANTKQAETAQDFITFSLGDKAQTLNMNTYEPITLDTFRSAVRGDGMDADEDGMICELYLGENIDSFYIYAPTEEENTSLEQQIRQIDHAFTEDVVVRDIVMETLASYLNGSTGLEDAVASATNRINLYLGE
ncbi:MAG: extracellular solute-binding protein [Blautia sp.]|nr:extracellular solute-binding protein [Blautia sp.]